MYKPDPDKIVDIPVDQLKLDPKNPRLAWRVEGSTPTQKELVKLLWTEMAVDEVALSIAENSFFRSEPLFVIPTNPDEEVPEKQQFIVVEGNRRLAAVLLLRNEKLRKEVRATNLPKISNQRYSELEALPTIVYPDRESLWATVGFRHINGIKPWDSFSKAEYVSHVHETYDVPLDDIAQKIGDTHATVRRLYGGYKLLEQAENEGVFDRDTTYRDSLYFSHLYTAADQKGYQDFLGINSDDLMHPNPVADSHILELGELMSWLYGNSEEDLEPVIETQNPDLRRLREVISKPEALSILRSTRSLDSAHDAAVGDKKLFNEALIKAKLALKDAMANVASGYQGEEDLFETMESILENANSLYDQMERKWQDARRTRVKRNERNPRDRRRD